MNKFNHYLEAAKTPKTYTLVWTRRGKDRSTAGTLEELTKYFGYTLLKGNSWNSKIPKQPKNINALIKAINMSIDQTEGGYDRPYVSLQDNAQAQISESINNDEDEADDLIDDAKELLYHLQRQQTPQKVKMLKNDLSMISKKLQKLYQKNKLPKIQNVINTIHHRIG